MTAENDQESRIKQLEAEVKELRSKFSAPSRVAASPSPKKQASSSSLAGDVPDFSVALKPWNDEQSKNEIAFELKYKGKLIQVSGYVYRIDRDGLLVADQLYPNPNWGSVTCKFEQPDLPVLARLSKGSKVTVRGVCSGSSFLQKCHLVDPAPQGQ